MVRIGRGTVWLAVVLAGAIAQACGAFGSSDSDGSPSPLPEGRDGSSPSEGGPIDGLDGSDALDGGDAARLAVESSAIACGTAHTCLLTNDASVLCWGQNDQGQLGNDGGSSSTPVRVPGLPPIVSVAAGSAKTCAIDVDAGLWCWGENSSGEMGIGQLGGTRGPNQVLAPKGAAGFARVTDVAMTIGAVCAVLDGVVHCAGSNSQGELGTDAGVAQTRLAPVPGVANAGAVTMGGVHACTVVPNAAMCWGNNVSGQCGVSAPLRTYAVAAQLADAGQPMKIAAGNSHTCIVDDQKHLWCWGYDQCGQGGPGSSQVPARPVAGTVSKLAAGGDVTCTVDGNGVVACIGKNDLGQLGIGTAGNACPNDVPTPIPGVQAKAVAVGGAHACALPTGGGVVCWGANDAGQLGTGDLSPHSSPVPVAF